MPVADCKPPSATDRAKLSDGEGGACRERACAIRETDGPPAAAKQTLRAELRARRQAMAPAVGSDAARRDAEGLCAQLVPAVDWSQVGWAALYAAVGHELDTEPLAQLLRARGVRTCYPRIAQKNPPELRFYAVADRAELGPASFGLLQPSPAADAVSPAQIDVFIVPGLAFDHRGRRLGQGRGYYDAYLQSSPGALRVGVCHPMQQISAVPIEPHDEPMDLLATPLTCLATGGRVRHRLQRLPLPPSDCDTVVAGTVFQPTESKP